jgi:RNA polymerase sigma factor (sigma-70 family)
MRERGPATSRSRRESGEADWPAALVELYRSDRLRLVRLAYLLTGRQGVAEEVVQEAFIATRRAWLEVRQPGQYVQRSVVNRCRSWGRHQQVVRAHRPAPPEPSLLEPDELWDALERLDVRRRAAIVLRYYIGLTHREIAGILGCRPATVRTSIHRGLKQLGK